MRLFLFVPLTGVFVPLFQGPSLTAAFPSGTVDAKGVCDVRPETVACWDMTGMASPALVESIRGYFGSNSQEAQFRLGKKNRYLVLRRPQALQVSYRMGVNNQLSASSIYNADPVTDFIRIAADPSDTSAMLSVQTTTLSKDEVTLPLREGATLMIDGRKVEVGPATRVVPPAGKPVADVYDRSFTGTGWSVVVGIGGEGYVSWVYSPVDESGLPIRYVDADGRPITALKALSLEPTLTPNNYPVRDRYGLPLTPAAKPKAAVAVFQANGGAPAFRAHTNIDPKLIAGVRIRTNRTTSVEIGPFPLDAK